MAKNKVYRLLEALSKRELQKFRLFLNSPYHNKSPIVLTLFDYIRPFHPDFEHDELDYNNIFIPLENKRIQVFNNQQLKAIKNQQTELNTEPEKLKKSPEEYVVDRMYDLNNRLESFLAIQHLKKNIDEKEILFRKALLEHKCYKYFLNKSQKKIVEIEKKPILGWNNKLELWSLHHSIFSHPQTQRYNGKINLAVVASQYLDDAYAILKLRYTLHSLLRQETFAETATIPPIIKEIINNHQNSKKPVFLLYIHAIAYFNNNNKDIFWEELRQLYLQHVSILPMEEKLVFLNVLISTKNNLAKAKNSIYFNEILLLYKESLKYKFWEFLKEFPSITFKNITILGASTKKIPWTIQFIDKYQKYISENERADTVAYSLAYLKFYNKEFEVAAKLLYQAPLSKPEDKLINRSLYCRCLYELNDPTLSARLNAFSKFINEQKLNKNRKESYKNLIYAIRLLSKIKNRKAITKNDIKILKDKLNKQSHFIAYNWIMEKVEELEM